MDSISLSDKFKEVEEIISYLDKEDIDIEDAVCKYAKAKGLLEECRSKIDTAKKLEQNLQVKKQNSNIENIINNAILYSYGGDK